MAYLYASAIGTTVLQLKEIPRRPVEFDGKVVLFGLKVSEEKMKEALGEYGEIIDCEVSAMVVVRFTTHESARRARREAAQLSHICEGIDTLFNERSYDGRRGDEGVDDDDGRGWCTFESSVSSELIVRLEVMQGLRSELKKLPPKMLRLSDARDTEPVDLGSETLDGRVDRVTARIRGATFTGKGDKEIVPKVRLAARMCFFVTLL